MSLSAGIPRNGRPVYPSRLGAGIILLFYLALSLGFFGWRVDWTTYYLGYSNDSLLFIWFLKWWPFAISHELNPFICKYALFPVGDNTAWATSIPVLALFMWPVTALGGPILSFNILAVTAPALAAWTAYLLIQDITRNRAAALTGGFLFGFCGPELYQLGQLNLSSVYLVPLAVLLGLRRVQGRLSRRAFVILLSILLAIQLGISTEILAALCLMAVLAWGVFLIFAPAGTRAALWRLVLDIAIAAPLTVFLAAPFIFYLVLGLPDVPAQIHADWLQWVEALRFFVPALPVASGWAALAAIARQFNGFRPDAYAYISPPLLLILVLYFFRRPGRPYAGALLTLLFVMALLSLGPILVVNGRITDIKLPWALFSDIPIIRSLIPVRLLLFFALTAAIITGLWLSEAERITVRIARFALAGLACLCLRPAEVRVLPEQWQVHPMFQAQNALLWSRWPEQPFFTVANIKAALGDMPNVLLLPDPLWGPGIAWQLNAGLSFTQTNGYVGFLPKSELKWNDLTGFMAGGPPIPDFGAAFMAYCAAHRVEYILIGPATPPLVVRAIEALGWPRRVDQGIEIVSTPRNLF